jgi:hypothetical protein
MWSDVNESLSRGKELRKMKRRRGRRRREIMIRIGERWVVLRRGLVIGEIFRRRRAEYQFC